MENYYKVLGLSPSATHHDVKMMFQQLARQYHPDKSSSVQPTELQNDADSTSKFILVSEAWNILGNADSRREYDAAWHQRCIAQESPVQDIVGVNDLDVDVSGTVYLYPCRCGAEYLLTEQHLSFKVDYVSCSSCSLCIKLQYT